MRDNATHADGPNRRSVATGAAWTFPVLIVAGLAPRLAASTLGCTAASQQEINNAITLAKQKSAKLQVNFRQIAEAKDGGPVRVFMNLKNKGSTPLLASPEKPIVLRLSLYTADPAKTRDVTDFGTIAWGTVTKGAWADGQITFTWTITSNLPRVTNPGNEADMRFVLGGGGIIESNKGKRVHAEVVMTSFGVNDDLQATDFPELSEILPEEQVGSCQDYYDAQVQANLTADYTLLAWGSKTPGDGIDWPVGSSVSSLTIGNSSPGGTSESKNGIW